MFLVIWGISTASARWPRGTRTSGSWSTTWGFRSRRSKRPSAPFARLPGLLELAVHPNVAVKLCGAPSLSLQPYPFEDVWASVRQILDAFGASRVMWASDISHFQGRVGWALRIPGADQHYTGKHSYAESLALYRDTDLLSQSEKELVLGGTVRRLLGWSAG